MKFCKDLLGVQKQTTNSGVLLELGKCPLYIYARKNCIKNWARIHITGKANEILLLTHQMSLKWSLKWTHEIKNTLDKSGIGCGNNNPAVHNMVFKRMEDIFYIKKLLQQLISRKVN